MKKLLVIISVLFMSVFSAMNTFAGSETYAFYFYFIDSSDAVDYNSVTIRNLKEMAIPENVFVTYDTSLGVTLNDFIAERIKTSNANHKYLIMVGKGEGVYGFKETYGKNISYNDIKEALANNLVKSDINPPIDLVVMDADLMANAEIATILKGYTNYLVAPENIAYDAENLYEDVIRNFSNSEAKSTVTLGKIFCDTYMDKVLMEVAKGKIITTNLSLIDVNNLSLAFNSYKTLTKNMLKLISKDNFMLSNISQEAKVTVAVGETISNIKYNLIDFYDFMVKLKKYFPLECSNVIKQLEKSMIYKGTSPLMLNAFGMSLFFPMYNFEGFEYLLADYNMNIADSDFISSLYNYKFYGTVTEEQRQRLVMAKVGKLRTFNRDGAVVFGLLPTEIKNNKLESMVVNLPNELKEIEQDIKVEVFRRDDSLYTYYNNDGLADFTAKRNVKSNFNGNWIQLNNIPMYCQILTDTYDYTRYGVDVSVNGIQRRLYYAFQSGVPKIAGIQYETKRPEIFGAVVSPLLVGDTITLYAYQNNQMGGVKIEPVTTFTYNNNYVMEETLLPDGDYTCRFMFEDLKGELTPGENILFTIKNRAVEKVITEKELLNK